MRASGQTAPLRTHLTGIRASHNSVCPLRLAGTDFSATASTARLFTLRGGHQSSLDNGLRVAYVVMEATAPVRTASLCTHLVRLRPVPNRAFSLLWLPSLFVLVRLCSVASLHLLGLIRHNVYRLGEAGIPSSHRSLIRLNPSIQSWLSRSISSFV